MKNRYKNKYVFFLYQLILSLILILNPIIFLIIILKKKEHTKRFIEKFSFPSKKENEEN